MFYRTIEYLYAIVIVCLKAVYWFPSASLHWPSYRRAEIEGKKLSFMNYVMLYGSLQSFLVKTQNAQIAIERLCTIADDPSVISFGKWLVRINGDSVNH